MPEDSTLADWPERTKRAGLPPFLILHVASRRDSKAQSEELAAKLHEVCVEANVEPAEGKTHLTINRELGEPDDAPTKAVFEFLRSRCEKAIPKSRISMGSD